jgi:type III secretion system YscI/HrpB-like protein
LEQLRSVFDSQYDSVGSKLQGTTLDVTAMMQLQADLVEYSVLVDVSSKLAGKVTTAVDSLMKGQ